MNREAQVGALGANNLQPGTAQRYKAAAASGLEPDLTEESAVA